MKAIIKGKRYDTENAEKICPVVSDDGQWSFTADLYVTKNETYFLAGSGEKLSKFEGENKIIPFDTRYDALCFVENYLSYDEVEKYFGEIIKEG